MQWDNPPAGIRCKEHIKGNQKIRLVEFSDKFTEADWCTKCHIVYVIEGKISIDFDGRVIHYQAGDGLFIAEGESNKHKASVARGEKALLVLCEILWI
jgi:quercetin dioxygenase-like cupin family protein